MGRRYEYKGKSERLAELCVLTGIIAEKLQKASKEFYDAGCDISVVDKINDIRDYIYDFLAINGMNIPNIDNQANEEQRDG